MTVPNLQIYGQGAWHDPACIVGNDDGLRALRAILDEILDPPEDGDASSDGTLFAYDGEGYELFVLRRAEEPTENHYNDTSEMGMPQFSLPDIVWKTLKERADARMKAREEGKPDE